METKVLPLSVVRLDVLGAGFFEEAASKLVEDHLWV
jgi:hypothetical protein